MTEAERVLAEVAKRVHLATDAINFAELRTILAPYLPRPEPDRLTVAAREICAMFSDGPCEADGWKRGEYDELTESRQIRAIIAREVAAAEPHGATMTKLADELEALAKDGWQDIANAPVNTPVRVKAGNMTFIARIVLGASMTSDEQECNQWQAEHEGEHPPCWSGGACWESNEDEAMSLQPTYWQPIAALRQPDGVPGDDPDREWADKVEAQLASMKPAVPGDLVERLGHCSQNTDDEYLHELTGRAAAAIQSLTAERDAALARVVALEAGLPKLIKFALAYAAGTGALFDAAINEARALLEGSKP